MIAPQPLPLPAKASPLPPRTGRQGLCKYPFKTMEVGEVFFIPGRDAKTMYAQASARGRQLGRKFSVRTVWIVEGSMSREDGFGAVKGIGVWRVL